MVEEKVEEEVDLARDTRTTEEEVVCLQISFEVF